MVKLIVLVSMLAVWVGCEGDPDEDPARRVSPCEQLRDHLIDLRLADAMHVDKDAHREALRMAMGSDFLEGCSKLSDDAISCVLEAHDSTTASACAGAGAGAGTENGR